MRCKTEVHHRTLRHEGRNPPILHNMGVRAFVETPIHKLVTGLYMLMGLDISEELM
jgi:hypothetical protein